MSLFLTQAPGADYRPNVGIMLLNAQGQVFVGRRHDTPDAWQMPQGGIDEGETPAEAVLRELREEVGTTKAEIIFAIDGWIAYDLPPEIAAKSWGGRWKGQAQQWFVLRFTGEDTDIDIDTEHPEFSAWRWVERHELPQLIIGFKRPVYEALLIEVEPKLRAMTVLR
jgi:putative (di)nucleoside polyphosphate hydrolase